MDINSSDPMFTVMVVEGLRTEGPTNIFPSSNRMRLKAA